MKKMKTLFVIDRSNDLAINQLNDGCEWIFDSNVTASIKFEGTAAFFKNGQLYKRQNRKLKKKFNNLFRSGKLRFEDITIDMFKDIRDGSIPCEEKPDPVTLHFPHWVPVSKDAPEDKNFIEAWNNADNLEDNCSYELIGKKVQHNLYNLDTHKLVKHGSLQVDLNDLSFDSLKDWLKNNECEGIVFKHPDGRMCKIRRKDFFDFKNLNGGRKVDWRNDNIIF